MSDDVSKFNAEFNTAVLHDSIDRGLNHMVVAPYFSHLYTSDWKRKNNMNAESFSTVTLKQKMETRMGGQVMAVLFSDAAHAKAFCDDTSLATEVFKIEKTDQGIHFEQV